MPDYAEKNTLILHISKKSCTFAQNFALRMVAIATKFEPNSMLWIY